MEQSYYIPRKEQIFLNLTRPIVFYDLETTGKSPAVDRIVEIFAIKLHPDGSQEELHHYLNPTVPIPPEATAIHGITDEMVANKPIFRELVEELSVFFTGCDLGGYNVKKYDGPMLMEEFHRYKKYPIDLTEVKMIDAMAIYHTKEKRDLSAALRFYCQREHTEAHSAKADVLATIDILKHQLLKYEDLEPNTSFLHDYLSSGASVDLAGKFVRDERGNIVFNFSEHKGKEACTERGFLQWILKKEFSFDTKMVAQRIYDNCLLEDEIRKWLNDNKARFTDAAVITMYTVIKFGKDVFPFSTKKELEKLTVTYLTEPPVSLTLANSDAKQVLLNILDKYFKKKGIALPENN